MLRIEEVEAALQRVLASERVDSEYIGHLAQRSPLYAAYTTADRHLPLQYLVDHYDQARPGGRIYIIWSVAVRAPKRLAEFQFAMWDDSTAVFESVDSRREVTVASKWLEVVLARVGLPEIFEVAAAVVDSDAPARLRARAFRELVLEEPERMRPVAQRWLKSNDPALVGAALECVSVQSLRL